MRKLPYYHSFSHKANTPSIDLAERLVGDDAADACARVFFANSGSEANDTVVKLVWYYNNAIGRPQKKKIIARLRGYHGITVASGSLTGLPWNHRDFDLPIANILHTACPHHYRYGMAGESEEEFASRLAGQFEELILSEGPGHRGGVHRRAGHGRRRRHRPAADLLAKDPGASAASTTCWSSPTR